MISKGEIYKVLKEHDFCLYECELKAGLSHLFDGTSLSRHGTGNINMLTEIYDTVDKLSSEDLLTIDMTLKIIVTPMQIIKWQKHIIS